MLDMIGLLKLNKSAGPYRLLLNTILCWLRYSFRVDSFWLYSGI